MSDVRKLKSRLSAEILQPSNNEVHRRKTPIVIIGLDIMNYKYIKPSYFLVHRISLTIFYILL